jgi:hypothetical protein
MIRQKTKLNFRKFPSNTTKITQDGIQNKWSRPIKTSIKKRWPGSSLEPGLVWSPLARMTSSSRFPRRSTRLSWMSPRTGDPSTCVIIIRCIAALGGVTSYSFLTWLLASCSVTPTTFDLSWTRPFCLAFSKLYYIYRILRIPTPPPRNMGNAKYMRGRKVNKSKRKKNGTKCERKKMK